MNVGIVAVDLKGASIKDFVKAIRKVDDFQVPFNKSIESFLEKNEELGKAYPAIESLFTGKPVPESFQTAFGSEVFKRYYFWALKKPRAKFRLYCFSAERAHHGKFSSWIVVFEKGVWKIVKLANSSRRIVAAKRVYRWYLKDLLK